MTIQWGTLAVLCALGVVAALGLWQFANWDGLAAVGAASALGLIIAFWDGVARVTRL
jgi:hypothetical protein